MSGMPPATAASNASVTPRRRASSYSSGPWWAWRIFATPAPTVPRPSNPIRTSWTGVTGGMVVRRSAVDVLEAAEGLLDPLLVLHERESHVALAVLAEADARRHGDLRLLDEQLGELERAERAEGLGDGRPHEHRALRLGDRPPELVQSVDEDVAALAVHLDDLL